MFNYAPLNIMKSIYRKSKFLVKLINQLNVNCEGANKKYVVFGK